MLPSLQLHATNNKLQVTGLSKIQGKLYAFSAYFALLVFSKTKFIRNQLQACVDLIKTSYSLVWQELWSPLLFFIASSKELKLVENKSYISLFMNKSDISMLYR